MQRRISSLSQCIWDYGPKYMQNSNVVHVYMSKCSPKMFLQFNSNPSWHVEMEIAWVKFTCHVKSLSLSNH